MQKADTVFALIMFKRSKRLVFWKSEQGTWSLPWAVVKSDESEAQMAHAAAINLAGYVVVVEKQIGPMYHVGGLIAKAYDCKIEEQSVPRNPTVKAVQALTLQEFRNLRLTDMAQRQIALDAYTALWSPDNDGNSMKSYGSCRWTNFSLAMSTF
jgi:hypothetical protein